MGDKNQLARIAMAIVFVRMESGNTYVYSAEVPGCVNIKKKNGDARNVKETASALTANKKTVARSVEVQAYALTAGRSINARIVEVQAFALTAG